MRKRGSGWAVYNLYLIWTVNMSPHKSGERARVGCLLESWAASTLEVHPAARVLGVVIVLTRVSTRRQVKCDKKKKSGFRKSFHCPNIVERPLKRRTER